jgi:hypothetical protein
VNKKLRRSLIVKGAGMRFALMVKHATPPQILFDQSLRPRSLRQYSFSSSSRTTFASIPLSWIQVSSAPSTIPHMNTPNNKARPCMQNSSNAATVPWSILAHQEGLRGEYGSLLKKIGISDTAFTIATGREKLTSNPS